MIRINANIFETVNKKDGKEMISGQGTISKDGKTSTATLKIGDGKGQETTSSGVYDKQ
jgi:hypothetical protein